MQLSRHSLRKWRGRLAPGEIEIGRRADLHPSARPAVSARARNSAPESTLTAARIGDPAAPAMPIRRAFSDEAKLAIVQETTQPDAKISAVARKHGIVTGLLFRRRAELGVGREKLPKLAHIVLSDDTAAVHALRDLVRPRKCMMATDLANGRRVFCSCRQRSGCSASADRQRKDCTMMFVPAGVKVHLALGYTDMREGMDGFAIWFRTCRKRIRSPPISLPFEPKRHRSRRCCSGMATGFACSPNASTRAASCGR
jgi:transposase-like protein